MNRTLPQTQSMVLAPDAQSWLSSDLASMDLDDNSNPYDDSPGVSRAVVRESSFPSIGFGFPASDPLGHNSSPVSEHGYDDSPPYRWDFSFGSYTKICADGCDRISSPFPGDLSSHSSLSPNVSQSNVPGIDISSFSISGSPDLMVRVDDSSHMQDHPEHVQVPRERYKFRSRKLITDKFCSAKCMATLKFGLDMDLRCPNAALHFGRHLHPLHQHDGVAGKHMITVDQVLEDIQVHLRIGSIWDIMEPILGLRGHRSQFFRLIHPRLGYAFAAKGVEEKYEDDLEQEAEVYKIIRERCKALDPLRPFAIPALPTAVKLECAPTTQQALPEVLVPLCFGVVSPPIGSLVIYPFWPFEGHVEEGLAPNTFLLLSYHGESFVNDEVWEAASAKLTPLLDMERVLEVKAESKVTDVQMAMINATSNDDVVCKGGMNEQVDALLRICSDALKSIAVIHGDLAWRNVLWDNVLGCLVIIDFERALVLDDERFTSDTDE